MSRLATVVGALSAIVSLVDYLAAKSFLSHWLQRQILHAADGWQISPTLNLLLIAAAVGLVWLLTESPVSDPLARKRLLRLRTNLVVAGLICWFCFGPSIGDCEVADAPAAPTNAPVPPSSTRAGETLAVEAGGLHPGPTVGQLGALPAQHGHTSQFTWKRPSPASPIAPAWKPGDGLRAMARLFEDARVP